MAQNDVSEVSRLQTAALKGSVVTELGMSFLTRFHAAGLAHPSTRAFVAMSETGSITGVVVASLDVRAFNRYVKPRVLMPLLRSMASRRGLPVAWRVARSLAVERAPRPDIRAELLLLVVDSGARRRGVGRSLVHALESEFRRCETPVYRVGVRTQLNESRAFYEALGFEVEQTLPVLGAPMTYLVKRLP